MLQSKALKDPGESKSSKLYLWWIDTRLSKWYYDFTWKYFGNPLFQVKRLFQWYWHVFRFDYDFDGHCLFRIIEYKLKRMLPVLEDGHAIQEDKDIKALKLAIKLAGRLKNDNYEMVYYDRHDKKWGELKTWTSPTKDGKKGMLLWNSSRPKVVTPEDYEQERKDRNVGYLAADAKMRREELQLYGILNKYLRKWWD